MIDLKKKPFLLNDDDISWVMKTLDSLDRDQKIGQLFCPLGRDEDDAALAAWAARYQPAGVMFRPGAAANMQRLHNTLQKASGVPLLVAANLEAGGTGSALEGTFFGKQMQAAATDDENVAYHLGLVCGREGRAVGCNWAFAPVVDIDLNFRSPITNLRTYGSDPERVLRMAKAYMAGLHESGLAVSIKHFPGDGVDERDQHLLTAVNSLSVEEWDRTFGMVYRGMIDAGAQTLMVGHIMLPSYSRKLVPGMADADLKPATLAPELLGALLRKQLGFNGLIVTDASTMVGFTTAEPRERAVPLSIAAGCDLFLFNKNIDEDYLYMRRGIERGLLTMERVDEAITRTLALKASLKLHRKREDGSVVVHSGDLEVIKCAEHEAWARVSADKAITLVKDTQSLLPLDPDKHRKVLVHVLGDEAGRFGESVGERFVRALEKEGFKTTVFDKTVVDFFASAKSVEDFKRDNDLVIYLANLETYSNKTVVRINWVPPMGSDAPWFVREVPTLFVSVANPYHLLDVPMMKTFVNAYSSSEYVIEALMEKLMGRSPFKGISPVDPFCGRWEAKL